MRSTPRRRSTRSAPTAAEQPQAIGLAGQVSAARSSYECWQHTQLLIDIVPGRGSGFWLEAPLGVRFLTRSRVFSKAEQAWLDACPPPRGPQPSQEG